VHISELSEQHVESPEQVVQVGEQVRVKVVDVDVVRRRISLSTKRVAEEPELLPEPEIRAEAAEITAEAEAGPEPEPEPSTETREALEDAAVRGDESTPEAFEATIEPEQAAPEEAAMKVVDEAAPEPEPEPEPEAEEAPAEEATEEDLSLESIVEDLKRREGRS